jgi:hypothetical protein
MSFGPWLPHLSPEERTTQFRLMAGLAALLCGPRSAVVTELRQAEHDAAAAENALVLLNAVLALTRASECSRPST